jgi:hypothetical protein
MDKLLKLPRGELAKLATHQRREQLKRDLGERVEPLLGHVRALILRKCHPDRQPAVRAIFETQPFGELERLVTKAMLDLVSRIATQQLGNEHWLRTVAKLAGRNFQQMRVVVLEFLDTDIFHVSSENCRTFLDPFIESWDIDLVTFALEFALNPKVSAQSTALFQFCERQPAAREAPPAGFAAFVKDRSLSGSATDEELAFLEGLRFPSGQPTALYYYRALHDLRDPLHFRPRRKGSAA